MKIFDAECYVLSRIKRSWILDAEKGIFVGYDKYSPADNVYYPEIGKVKKTQADKFITRGSTDSQTETDCDMKKDTEIYENTLTNIENQGQIHHKENEETRVEECTDSGRTQTEVTQGGHEESRYPVRQCKAECNNDGDSVDYFYRVTYGVPTTFK